MLNILIDLALGIVWIALTILFASVAYPMGGVIYSALPFLMNREWPYVSRLLKYLFLGPLYLGFLFKAIGYVVSSVGMAVPLILVHVFAPGLLGYSGIYWGAALACLCITLKIMHGIQWMRTSDFMSMLESVIPSLKVDLNEIDRVALMRLVRTHFTDVAVIDLLKVVFAYGVIVYCSGLLTGVLPLPAIGELGSSLEKAFVFLRFLAVSSVAYAPAEFWGHAIGAFYAICLLVFITFYISLASKLLDEGITDERLTTMKISNVLSSSINEKEMQKFLMRSLDGRHEVQSKDETRDSS